jgi:hypothetical protein
MKVRTMGFAGAVALALAATAATALAQDARTLKERLSDKASDAQRVDNCHVPPGRRGPLPRPDCPSRLQAEGPGSDGTRPARR